MNPGPVALVLLECALELEQAGRLVLRELVLAFGNGHVPVQTDHGADVCYRQLQKSHRGKISSSATLMVLNFFHIGINYLVADVVSVQSILPQPFLMLHDPGGHLLGYKLFQFAHLSVREGKQDLVDVVGHDSVRGAVEHIDCSLFPQILAEQAKFAREVALDGFGLWDFEDLHFFFFVVVSH